MRKRMRSDLSLSRRRSGLALPVIFSLLIHGALLFIIFHGGRQQAAETYKAPLAQRLSYLDEYVFENVQRLMAGYEEEVKRLNKVREEASFSRWTMDNMPERVEMLASSAEIKLKGIKIIQGQADDSNGGKESTDKPSPDKERYDIIIEIMTNPDDALTHILTVANIVGEGTLYSNFLTDNLEILIKENRASAPISFVIPTRDCRLLFRDKTSPQEFLVGGAVRGG